MRMAAPAHRRDEIVAARTARAPMPAAPGLQLASLIGNHAMRRLVAQPNVQRSLWDDITGAASQVSEWFGGGETAPQEQPAVDAPMQNSDGTDGGLQPSNDPAFDDVQSPAEIRDEAGADEAADTGSWFESWFTQQEQEQAGAETAPEPTEPQAAENDACAWREAEIAYLNESIQELYDQTQAMLPELEAAKAQMDELERTSPGSAEAARARQRFNQLDAHYNDLVDRCLYLIELRNALRQDLEACREEEKGKPTPMPDGFPCC